MPRIYRLYIDESGDHSYGKKELRSLRIKFMDRTINYSMEHYPELEKEEKRYLGLTGCIIEIEKYRSIFHPKFEELKSVY